MERIVEIPDCIKSKEKADPFSLDYGWPVREEIVRCRDCKSVENTLCFSDGDRGSVARNVPFCVKLRRETDPDGFCAWGERRG